MNKPSLNTELTLTVKWIKKSGIPSKVKVFLPDPLTGV